MNCTLLVSGLSLIYLLNAIFFNDAKFLLYVSIKSIKVLAKSKVLQKVKHLNIGRNYLHPDSARALADTKTLVNVETTCTRKPATVNRGSNMTLMQNVNQNGSRLQHI